MLDIRWALLAQADLTRIVHHYGSIDPALAASVAERIVGAICLLSELPHAGQATDRAQRRRWRVPATPYVIFYRIVPDHVRVLRVLHGARLLAGQL